MKRILVSASALALSAGIAHAGGIERSANSYGFLFEEGTQVQIGVAQVRPEISGDYAAGLGGGSTGDMADDYSSLSFSYKNELSDGLDLGVYVNDGYGANATYSAGTYNGLAAEWDSQQIAAILKYRLSEGASIYGGMRHVTSTAEITIPDLLIRGQLPAGLQGIATSYEYNASGAKSSDVGYVLGAAYEIPDIALRVGLTYESEITQTFSTSETMTGTALAPATQMNSTTDTDIVLPKSFTLDFQSGIAEDTLLFGSIKWAEWSKWEVRPDSYEALTGDAVTGLDNDVTTWNLGIGRRFSENLSGFAQVGFEKSNGGVASRLAPTDGQRSLGLGVQYTQDNLKIRAGLSFVELGDATDGSGTEFTGNSATGAGVSVTFGF